METNLKIGPYTLFKRTEYSKFQVLDINGNNISKTKEGISVLTDYEKVMTSPDIFFEIDDKALIKYKGKDIIENLFIPEYIESIEQCALTESKFKYISLPSSLVYISEQGFDRCTRLKEIELPNSLNSITEWGMFNSCWQLEKIILPKNTDIIPILTFSNCRALKQIDLPDTLLYIEEDAFSYCEQLEKITLPDSILQIESRAFQGCTSLKEINIPKELTSFGINVFSESGLETLIFNHNFNKRWFGCYGDYLKNTNINKIVIKKDVEFIDPALFKEINKQIKTIEYIGTKKEFDEFSQKNEGLFEKLNKAKISIINETLDNKITFNKPNTLGKILKHFTER